MAGSISDFRASFLGDLARPSRFDVSIYVPNAFSRFISGSPADVVNVLNMRCENAELPGRTLQTHELKTYGPVEKFPYQNSYNDLNLTFIVSDNMFERYFFDNWLNFISSTNDFNFKYKNDYVTDIAITQYDVAGRSTYAVQLLDAFPIAVNQMDLDWSSDGHHKLTVVFAYTNWINITNDIDAPSIQIDNTDSINSSTDNGATSGPLIT